MGGTFDPIHLGHLRAAECARDALGLELVLFVPSGIPPHRSRPASPALDRFAMVCLATAGHDGFSVSDAELTRAGPSYTVDTVRGLLRDRPGDSISVIVGSDTFPEMWTWKDPKTLFSLCSVAVVLRPGCTRRPIGARRGGPGPRVLRVPGPALPVAATTIRRRVREGRSVRYLVPDAVAEYIGKRGLYR